MATISELRSEIESHGYCVTGYVTALYPDRTVTTFGMSGCEIWHATFFDGRQPRWSVPGSDGSACLETALKHMEQT